jgi:predicted nucleotidyltransferase
MERSTHPRADDAVARLASRFQAMRLPGIVSVHLFGSVAHDRGHRESDVDVAVLVDRALYPSSRERFNLRVRLAASCQAPSDGQWTSSS